MSGPEDKTKQMNKTALKLTREQIKKHSLGKLEFFAAVGTRPWGIAQENVDYDYRGIYSSREDNTYQAFISGIYINNSAKDITLISLERFILNIFRANIHSLIVTNSPIVFASKASLEFKKWINSNFSKKIYNNCQTKQGHNNRKDYLYDFFFMGNGVAILEKKKVIANLPELNKKILKIPAINTIIKQEKERMPFRVKDEQSAKKAIKQLKNKLERANKKTVLPEKIDEEKFRKLKIFNRINFNYWHWPDGGPISRERGRRKKKNT